jgi:integrase
MARFQDMRREWASGSIYQHGDRWRVSVSLGSDAFGKRIRKEWQVRSEASAKRKLREVQARLRGGLPAEESRITVSAYAHEWLVGVKPTVNPSTYSFYRTLSEIHLDEIAHLPLAHLSPQDIRRLIAKRLEEGYSTRTVRGILDVLRMILKQAVNDGILTRNVAELVTPPKLEQAAPIHFTVEQARRFLEVAKDDELHGLYAVALGTGLRRGELLALTWRDVAPDRKSITIRRAKTAAGVREVPLPRFAVSALEAERRGTAAIWPYRPEYVTRHFQELCERAGVPYIKFHGLRHTAASLMLDEGIDPLTIQAILGHSRVSMTSHYARAGEERRREAVERLGRAIG